MDYDLVEKLGQTLCEPALQHTDPVAQIEALGSAQLVAAALEDYVVERRSRVIQQAIDSGASRVGLAKSLGLARTRVQQMLKAGERVRAKRTAKGAEKP